MDTFVFTKHVEIPRQRLSFSPGQPVPPEFNNRESLAQLKKTFGEDCVVAKTYVGDSFAGLSERISALEDTIGLIAESLGVKGKKKKQDA